MGKIDGLLHEIRGALKEPGSATDSAARIADLEARVRELEARLAGQSAVSGVTASSEGVIKDLVRHEVQAQTAALQEAQTKLELASASRLDVHAAVEMLSNRLDTFNQVHDSSFQELRKQLKDSNEVNEILGLMAEQLESHEVRSQKSQEQIWRTLSRVVTAEEVSRMVAAKVRDLVQEVQSVRQDVSGKLKKKVSHGELHAAIGERADALQRVQAEVAEDWGKRLAASVHDLQTLREFVSQLSQDSAEKRSDMESLLDARICAAFAEAKELITHKVTELEKLDYEARKEVDAKLGEKVSHEELSVALMETSQVLQAAQTEKAQALEARLASQHDLKAVQGLVEERVAALDAKASAAQEEWAASFGKKQDLEDLSEMVAGQLHAQSTRISDLVDVTDAVSSQLESAVQKTDFEGVLDSLDVAAEERRAIEQTVLETEKTLGSDLQAIFAEHAKISSKELVERAELSTALEDLNARISEREEKNLVELMDVVTAAPTSQQLEELQRLVEAKPNSEQLVELQELVEAKANSEQLVELQRQIESKPTSEQLAEVRELVANQSSTLAEGLVDHAGLSAALEEWDARISEREEENLVELRKVVDAAPSTAELSELRKVVESAPTSEELAELKEALAAAPTQEDLNSTMSLAPNHEVIAELQEKVDALPTVESLAVIREQSAQEMDARHSEWQSENLQKWTEHKEELVALQNAIGMLTVKNDQHAKERVQLRNELHREVAALPGIDELSELLYGRLDSFAAEAERAREELWKKLVEKVRWELESARDEHDDLYEFVHSELAAKIAQWGNGQVHPQVSEDLPKLLNSLTQEIRNRRHTGDVQVGDTLEVGAVADPAKESAEPTVSEVAPAAEETPQPAVSEVVSATADPASEPRVPAMATGDVSPAKPEDVDGWFE